MIRGCNPQPGAWTTIDSEVVQVFDVELVNGSGRFGRVCDIDEDSFTVNAGVGGIRIKKLRYGKGGKISASVFVQEKSIKIGRKFGI